MPFSSERGKDSIKRMVSRVPHARILDVGCGSGTYALMFDDSQMTGIEIWEPYVEKYRLETLYDRLIVADARNWEPDGHYDVAIAGDVLEHMDVAESKRLLKTLRACSDTVVVSIPLGHYPQGEYEGNPYEIHVTDHWTHESVVEAFGSPDWHCVDGEIGVYIWSKHKLRPKICVYAISKNEEQFVERFCEAAAAADLILIADTGSTDATADLARQCGAKVHDICISPWRFDHARNAALALVPREMDICVSLDLDEILVPGWREEVERLWELGKTTRLRYTFDWGSGIVFKSEKIHTRHGYHWHHPCHEYPVPDGRITEVYAESDKLLVVHKPDPSKSRGQYLDLLELSIKEDPYCPRNAFYYARELSFHGRWSEAIDACNRYLKMPNANWMHERCYAYRVMGKCYLELGDYWSAERMFRMAVYEAPDTREPWRELAVLGYRQERWEECFAAAIRGLRITERQMVYTADPEVWGHQLHDLASISAWHLGLHDIAIKHARIAVDMSPQDERLQANLRFLTEGPPKEKAA